MKEIDLKKCFFHAITPFHGSLKSYEENVNERLRFFLESGYVYSGEDLGSHLPDAYKDANRSSTKYIFLAMHYYHTLPLYGSYCNGEFSAFSEHIAGNLAFVFGEDILEGNTIPAYTHWLSEEVCIEGRIPIRKAKAIYYPKDTPIDILSYYMEECQEPSSFLGDYHERLKRRVVEIITNPALSIDACYKRIEEIQKILFSYHMMIPLVGGTGRYLEREMEMSYIKEKEEKVLQLLHR